MKRFLFFGAVCALLLGALFLANYKRQQSALYLLRQYPPSANLTYVIEHHTRPASAVIFRSDWFDRDTTGSRWVAKLNPMALKSARFTPRIWLRQLED